MTQSWWAHASATVSAQLSPQHTTEKADRGVCTTKGPPGQGFGKCFNLSATGGLRAGQGAQQCAQFVGTAGGVCPSVGVAHACVPSLDSGTDVCQTPEMVAWQHGHVPGGRCEQTRACALLPAARELASASCLCKPRDFASCEFSQSSCPSDSPYFPP